MSKRPYKVCKKVARQVIVFYGLTPSHEDVSTTLKNYMLERDILSDYSMEAIANMTLMVSELVDGATIDIKFNEGAYK